MPLIDERLMWIFLGILAAIGVILIALALIWSSLSTIASHHDHHPHEPPKGYRPISDKAAQERFGRYGEDAVFKMISEIAKESGGYAYQNVAFQDDSGYSSEIDAILICSGGFFVIEVKSNKGIIHGNAKDEQWYAEKEEWQEDKYPKNPILQNERHISHLKRMAGEGFPRITSLVIFPYAKSIEEVRSPIVHDCDSARDFINGKIAEGKYKKQTVDRFNNQLKAFLSRYGITHEQHIENIKRIYKA